ncbi:MAG: type II secretion system protein N, partial [Planctomycetota bacterium]
GAAVLLVGGAVLAMTVEPSLPAAPVVVPLDDPTDLVTGPAPEPIAFDWGLVSSVLNQAGGVDPKVPTEPTEIVVLEDESPDPIEPTRTTSNFRFLGGFFSPSRSLAIIAGAGRQRMARVGDEIDFGFTVNAITPEYVEIERSGVVERLDREVASGAVVATATPSTSIETPPDRLSPGTEVSQSARERLSDARELANQRINGDRAKREADFQRRREQRLEELRERGIDVDEAEWRRDD